MLWARPLGAGEHLQPATVNQFHSYLYIPKDDVLLQLQELLAPFRITRFYTDGWGAYERHLNPAQHTIGKAHTQKIESKHVNLRTRIKRLVRRTICFSKTTTMNDLVVGLFINRYEFRVAI